MSVNKHKPHVHLIPEDDANRQLAIGFINHHAVIARVIALREPAGGWLKVLDVFETEYLQKLRDNKNANVVMLIDFDDKVETRQPKIVEKIPQDVKDQAFFVGSKVTPEILKRELKIPSFEKIGEVLANECWNQRFESWQHPHLNHNSAELQCMVDAIRTIVFNA